MPSENTIVLVVLHFVFLVTSFICNGFILLAHFLDWFKTRKLSSSDLIISCLVTINIILQASVTLNEKFVLMFPEFYIQISLYKPLIAIMSSLTFSSLLCATCLCFYYCVKIVSFNGVLFYKIKVNITVLVPWLLAFSIIISGTAGLAAYWDIYTSISPSSPLWNTSSTILQYKSKCNCLFNVYMILSALAFFIISMTAGAIIFSLSKHIRQTTMNNPGFGSTRLTSLKSAAQTVTSLLILYLILFGSLNVIFNATEDANSLFVHYFFGVAASCPTINAIILIHGNRKLSKAIKHLLGIKSGTANSEVFVTTTH